MEFLPYDKIPRLYRAMRVTEKLDGTNGCIRITEGGEFAVQSRKRFITPGDNVYTTGDDVHGMARWAYSHRDELIDELGPGVHFGEWFGHKINRGYGLENKYFALFHSRWADYDEFTTPGLTSVPVLHEGPFSLYVVEQVMANLLHGGSAVNNFPDPEGVVVTHLAAGRQFKATLDNDGGKS